MLFHYLCAALVFSATAAKNAENEYVKKEDWQHLTTKFGSFDKMMQSMKAEIAALKENQQQHKCQEVTKKCDTAVKKAMNDSNIEERVATLEEQMIEVNSDIAGLDEQVENAETQIVLIKSDQVLQDQRLLELEDDTEILESNVQVLYETVNNLEASDASLNRSIHEVNTLVTDLTSTVESIEETVAGLSAADEDIIGQINDLSSRISQLEFDGTIAFHASMLDYTSIPDETVVIFSNVNVNLGGGYDGSTGQFTVPAGGAGLYYFFVHFLVDVHELANLEVRHNGDTVCVAHENEQDGGHTGGASCAAVISLQEGDVVDVLYDNGLDDTPLYKEPLPFHSFTGFRVAPE